MTVMLLQNNVCVYNNNNNLSKGGPTTIEDQFRQHFKKNETAANENRPRLNVFSLPHTGYPKRQGKAMNYYRLWIYTCNAVLLVSVLGFVIVAIKVVLVDPRRTLIPGLTLYEPSLLYAYLALLTQSGLLQLLGCVGAHKLNEKLLNMYWFLLLFLLFGDAFIGVVWIFRFDKMYTDIRPILRQRLQMEYGVNEEFTQLWNSIQYDFRCCGVEGPQDFNEIDLSRRNTGDKSNDTKENQRNTLYEDRGAENDRNRVIVNKSANWSVRDSLKGYITGATISDDNLTDDAKDLGEHSNIFLSTMSSIMSEVYSKETNVKYVRNIPVSCCRILTEEEPDENKEEKPEETQSKPTAIRQRLEKKKSRHQENKTTKRSAVSFETTCRDLKNCKNTSKRNAFDSKFLFRGNHVRHDSLYRNTHHYSTSTNTVVPNVTHDRKSKELRFATGNLGIMNTCANVNGHAIGTIYGMTETLHFSVGCEVKLKKWLRDSAHVLGVLGYCVIAFLKLCFLGILRYEIREMIQKIKMLQGELQPPILLLSAESSNDNPEMNSPTSPHAICNHMGSTTHINKCRNSIPNDSIHGSPERLRANSLGNAFFLKHSHDSGQTTPGHQIKTIQSTQQNQRAYSSILGVDPGNDSDTNSHCALLIEGDEATPKKKHSRVSSNGNNNYESHELQDLLARHTVQI
ncbi:hypothetical protein RUM44_003940 [Polyplax serrata]|uniref:Tetraspanin n=1 Tax=Polyplax serrata TaxID=468196 RepID=A0ABR1B1E2_POLSC